MDIKALLTIGKITGVHGLGGNLKVWSYAESADTFAPGRKIWLSPENGTQKRSGNSRSGSPKKGACLKKPYTILKSSSRKKGILLTLEGVDNRNQAEDLIGYEILVNRKDLPVLEEDTWYWEDLYGVAVIDEKRGNIGIIDRIFPTGANDVLVVKQQEDGTETLIPMHRHFIKTVDIEHRMVHTRLPEGL